MSKVKWGIISTGAIAHTFAKALVYNENSIPYAVASRTLEKAEAFGKEYGFEKCYGSYEELVKDEVVEVVYIGTPMHSHYEDALLCLNNGKNVLCEKAITINSKELDELLRVAKEKNLFFMEAMWMKCLPAFLKAQELVQSGAIGEVEMIKADFCNRIGYNEDSRLFRLDTGGGALLDLGVYTITFATTFLGLKPKEIISFAHFGQSGADAEDTVILKYENGAFATLNSGMSSESKSSATIIGSNGSIAFSQWFFCTSEFSLYDRDNNLVETFTIPHEFNGYEYEIKEVEACLAKGEKESKLVPHISTVEVMKIMDTCREQWGFKYPNEK